MTFEYNRPGCWRGLIGVVVVFAIGGQAAAQSTQPALEEKLTAADAAAGDHFGASVAVSGVTAVVGAEAADVVGLDSGAAYVFRRAPGLNTSWGQVAKLVATDAGSGDLFGAAVAVSGGRVVVGAPLDGDAGALSGSAYVFERRPDGSDEWDQTAKLVAPDGAPGDEFGAAVAIDGDTIVIGSPFDSDDGFASGAVYVYRYVPIGIGTWRAVQKLTASDAANSDRFGTAVAVERSEILIGAEFDDDNGPDSGSAYLFLPSAGHPTVPQWEESGKLIASDGVAGDRFGHAVDLSEGVAVAGAYRNSELAFEAGAVYVFEHGTVTNHEARSLWTESAKVLANDGLSGDGLGRAVAIGAQRIVAGAKGHDHASLDAGAAFGFENEAIGGAAAQWTWAAEVLAPDATALDAFGGSVAASTAVWLVGAKEDDDGGPGSGSAYVFRVPALLTLSLTGTCPGPLTLRLDHATAYGAVAFAWSANPGSATIPTGACAGAELGLSQPRYLGLVTADDLGRITLEPTVQRAVCGGALQAMDTTSCETSNVVTLQDSAASPLSP